jgi:Baseplate J-like protein
VIYSCCNENRKNAVLKSPKAITTTPIVNATGKGFSVGDVLTIAQVGSSGDATVTVSAVTGAGGVNGLSLTQNGTNYSTAIAVPTTGGGGTGCTLNITGIPNGIDYLEVLDNDAAALNSPRQRTLLVHCLNPVSAAVTRDNVIITGGESITGVTANWVAPASAPPMDLTNTLEQNYFSSLADAAKVLIVRTSVAGDFSPYTLQFVNNAATAEEDSLSVTDVLAGFDPQLADVEFSFKVECGPDFDCNPQSPTCPPDLPAPPSINYLAKDYGSFRTIILDRLSQLLPGWSGTSEADLGVALAELMAYVGDYMSYRQDAIATEAYLETARSRISLRRHALLVGYHVHDGCNARAWMQIQVSGNPGDSIPLDQATTRFYTQVPGIPSDLSVDSGNEVQALSLGVVFFEPMQDAVLHPEHNQISFYTWGDENCCLPKGATEATLSGSFPNLAPGDVLTFQETMGPQTGKAADADIRHRCAVRLTRVATQDASGNPLVDPLFDQSGNPIASQKQTPAPVTEIQWSQDDALPFPLCISSIYLDAQNDEQSATNVSVAFGNVVLADHGVSMPPKTLEIVPNPTIYMPAGSAADHCQPTFPAPVSARYWPTIPDSPITQAVPVAIPGPGAVGLSAYALTHFDADTAVPSIALTTANSAEVWEPLSDLLESEASDPVFVVEVESDGTARIRFGDDTNGKKPDSGTQFTVNYRIGNGSAGNVGAESLTGKATDPRILSCTNPLPAAGGTDAETADQIRRRAPQAFLTQGRAVTMADYESATKRNPQVDQAVANLRWTGSWYTVFVAVEPKGGGDLTPSLQQTLTTSVENFRLAGQDLKLESPQYVSLEIELKVCVDPGYFRSDVENSLLQVLGNQILPNGQKGLFYADNFTFGETVYLGPVYAAARSVQGVVAVQATKFQPQGFDTTQFLTAGEIKLGSLQVARLENDSSYPDHGQLTFVMEGGK